MYLADVAALMRNMFLKLQISLRQFKMTVHNIMSYSQKPQSQMTGAFAFYFKPF